ncbi:MAG: DNA-3-methyladenine glycosylase [Bacteroidetes bacterium]|nr:DNA-3-methyladenine glycosylase [Bacteroidota bacterium]
MKPLPRSFYLQPTVRAARKLLGKYFIRRTGKYILAAKIVEVEAYQYNDPASHSFHGKTIRNSVMFRKGGHLYVYFTYGMHFCANVVTGKEGIGEAVLIRAVEPLTGIDIMTKRRFAGLCTAGKSVLDHKSLIGITNGPAKFCQAFGITKKENGLDLLNSKIIITEGEFIQPKLICKSSRIGIKSGLEKQWRFFIRGNPWVSKK